MRCSKCATNNPSTNNFCAKCGTALAKRCAKCKSENPAASDFCGKCGAALTTDAGAVAATSSPPGLASGARFAPESASPEALEGERKTVTALFADIKGSTELEQDLDPEEAQAIVDPALKLMIDAARRYDGYIVQSTGDGIFALFGAPVAHEDHPQRALYAALRMQEELKRYSARLREAGNLPIEARVGVNSGEVVVRSITTGEGHTEYTPIGHTANLASRLQALAPTGSIAISEQTRKLVEGYFALKPLGPTRVKGVSEPVNVYEVIGLGPLRTRLQRSAGRGFTKFVGRQREMDAMKAAAEQALAGHGQIVAAVAEPGVGKSRLLFEFKALSQSGWTVLETFSVSHGKASSFLPVIDLLHGYFKITRDDDARTRREKVNGRVLTLERSLEDVLPYLFALLGIAEGADQLAGMDVEIRKRRTLDAIKRILLRESLNQPLMVIFEDLHWIDDETQALLNLVADSIATAKILLVVNYRPEYSHHWNSKTYYTQLRLDPLGQENAGEMLSALLGDGKELAPLKSLIIRKTEGTPFFMEEIVQGLVEDGTLTRNGITRLTRSLDTLKIPASVQAMLVSRIDRLPPNEKDLLQTIAVIGREFGLGLVRAVTGKSDDELTSTLSVLQSAEFLYEQPATGEVEYTFKHALTQEVAYNSILSDRRKLLHERIGGAIETLYAASLDDHLTELVHNYGRSGNAAKALEYHERAGRRAAERFANLEAVSHFNAALRLLEAMPRSRQQAERKLTLLLALGTSIMVTKGWGAPEVKELYVRASELGREVGETPQLFAALSGLAGFYETKGEFKPARELFEQNLSLAQRTGDVNFLLQTFHQLGVLQTWVGELTSARQSVDEVITRYDASKHHAIADLYSGEDPAVCCLSHKAWTMWLLGYPDQALQNAQASVRLAQQLSHPMSLALATSCMAQLHGFRRESANAIEKARSAAALSEEHTFPYFTQAGELTQCAFSPDRATADGIARFRHTLSRSEPDVLLSMYLGWLAEACLEGFHHHEAGAALSQAFAVVEGKGERMWEAELYRLRGELKSTDPVEAEADFHRALEVARSQQARSLELRATVSFARMLAKQRKRDEARAMLADIYNWFTEGFDTADLKEAKALLEELST
jgi:class 3 adenylate cyclase/tetratricopeptide (TPR) repeat protein